MKKYIFVVTLLMGSTAFAQPVNLACQGQIVSDTVFKKYSDLNEKNKKDWLMFNVIVEPSTNSLTIGSSYHTANLKYSTLNVSQSHYTMYHHWANPNSDYAYYSMHISIDRYTGSYKMRYSSLTKDANISSKFESNGTCQVGVHWLQKF
jgi:hypothetical protein